jgi:glycosyltransferase involved in cell wall biosynthesis
VTPTPSSFPRVLLVNGEPIGACSATGITMANLIGDWPRECLGQIYTAALSSNSPAALDYAIPPHQRRGLRQLVRGKRPTRRSPGLPAPAALPDEGAGLRVKLRPWLDLVPYVLPPEVRETVKQFRPDLVYSLMGNIQVSVLALSCAKLCGVPLVPHFMDDWIATKYVRRPSLWLQRRMLIRIVEETLQQAPFGLAISEVMADEYASRFGIPFHAFMNCSPVLEQLLPEPQLDAQGPRLVYVGGLHLARWRSLLEIADAVVELKSEGITGQLVVFAPAADLAAFAPVLQRHGVEIGGQLSPDQVADTLSRAHLLVHVESFEENVQEFTRLSISTKIAQYTAAGRPLFCYGPGEVASLRFVERHDCGVVVGSRDKQQLKTALKRALTDLQYRRALSAKALATAQQNFETVSVRDRFRELLAKRSVCAGPGGAYYIAPL